MEGSPNAAALNSAFMQASHWFEPDGSERRQRPYSEEELAMAQAAHEQAEASRQHMLYQQYASYGAASGYGEDGAAGEEFAAWESQYAAPAPPAATSHGAPAAPRAIGARSSRCTRCTRCPAPAAADSA